MITGNSLLCPFVSRFPEVEVLVDNNLSARWVVAGRRKFLEAVGFVCSYMVFCFDAVDVSLGG